MSFVSVPRSVLLYNADGSFRSPIYLVTIELDGTTLHLSSPSYVGPDGQPWDGVVDLVGQVNAGGDWLTARWNPVDLSLSIQDRRVTGQAVEETFLDLFPDYEFTGCRVHVQVAFENTISTSDYATIFDGRIERWHDMDATGVRFYCQQDRRFNVTVPPNTFTKDDYPYAPEGVIGSPRPILLGDWTVGSIIPTVSTLAEAVEAGVARGPFPAVFSQLESADGGLETPQVFLTDKNVEGEPIRLMFWEQAVEAYAYSLNVPLVTGTGPTLAQIDSYAFLVPITAVEVSAGTTTGVNAQELIRKDKSYTLEGHADLDYDAGERVLELALPDVPELGTFVTASVYIWYNKNSSSGSHPQFGAKNPVNGNGLSNLASFASSPSTGSTPHRALAVNVGPAGTGGSGSILQWSDIKNTTLFCEVRAATQTVEVHRILLTVYYKPSPRIVTPGTARRTRSLNEITKNPNYGRLIRRVFTGTETSPDVQAYDNAIYAFGSGAADENHDSGAADGTYTGTAGNLIEHPVDMAHWALAELGGVSSSLIAVTSGEFGSFEDARTALPNYNFACQISKGENLESWLEQLGDQALVWFFKRTTQPGAPWVAIPWDAGASQDYREASDLVAFNATGSFVVRDTLRVDRTPERSIVNDLRVNYNYDPRTRTYQDQLYIRPGASRVNYPIVGFTSDIYGREDAAADSADLFGTHTLIHDLPWVKDPQTATKIMERLFDWRVQPRLLLHFNTFLNAIDLERGHVLRLGDDWDDYLTYPKVGGDGSWAGKNLQVLSVVKLQELPVQYAVTAIET